MISADSRFATRAALGTLVALTLGHAAGASDGTRSTSVPLLPKYRQECAACHIAYPPGLLPAASWRRLLADLPHHFGTDASLDPTTLQQLAHWLEANAGSYGQVRRAGQVAEDRITGSVWFVREHDEVPASAWKLPAVKSPANCAACHTRADQGNFSERHVRIPR